MPRLTVYSTVIDNLDREIIRALVNNSRLTQRELGRSVGLSPNAAGARVQRLVSTGVITGFGARLNHAALGRPLEASIDVWQTGRNKRTTFEDLVKHDDRIVECFFLTGPLDFRLRARLASAEDLNDLLITMKNEGGVRQTDSRLILQHLSTEPD